MVKETTHDITHSPHDCARFGASHRIHGHRRRARPCDGARRRDIRHAPGLPRRRVAHHEQLRPATEHGKRDAWRDARPGRRARLRQRISDAAAGPAGRRGRPARPGRRGDRADTSILSARRRHARRLPRRQSGHPSGRLRATARLAARLATCRRSKASASCRERLVRR